jgi:hypothetical protein
MECREHLLEQPPLGGADKAAKVGVADGRMGE